MTPLVFLAAMLRPGLRELASMGGPQPSLDTERFLLAIAMQESGPGLTARYQNHPAVSPGPARGWWQFETAGVLGVMTHAASRDLAQALCDRYVIHPHVNAVWRALEGHDMLAAGIARLLVLTDPRPIPRAQEEAWATYLRTWRPGKPHHDTWARNWRAADAAVAMREVV